MQRIDTITFLFHARDMGAIDDSTIINWADSEIAKQETPSNWLLELSLANTTQGALALLEANGASNEIDNEWFLSMVAELYLNKGASALKAKHLLYDRFCADGPKDNDPLQIEIYYIDDELGWNEQRGTKRLKKLLKKHLSTFEKRLKLITKGT